MGEMKNAFEKAWERAESLGKLSPEELRRRKEKEFTPIGQAQAERYLEHGYTELLKEGLNRYEKEEENEIATKAALSRLVEAIELRNDETAARAMEGILALKGDRAANKIEEIKGTCQEYEQAEQKEFERNKGEMEAREREIMHQLRLSGNAVGDINPQASEIWRGISQGLYAQFEQRLHQLKQELCQLLASA
jgi:hypothetical protein